MATDLERLVVQLSADIKKYENALNRATGVTNRQMKRIEQTTAASVKRVNASLASIGKFGRGAAGAIGVGISVAGAQNLIDTAIRIENALKVAGLSGKELDSVYQQLFQSATKNAAPLETLVTLYGRIALVQKEIGASTSEVLKFTDSIAMALRVANAGPEAASGALLQLSQALGSGTVRAEEFNSLMEGALPILQAAAAGIKEAGGSVAKLRQIMLDGELSSRALFRGIEAGTPLLEERLANAVLTIDQRMTNLKTALVDAAKRFNNSTEAANTFGTAIDNIASFINSINFDAFLNQINRIVEEFARGQNAANNFANDVGEALGLDKIGKFLTGGQAQAEYLGGALTITSQKVIADRIADGFKDGAVAGSAEIDKVLKEKYAVAGTNSPIPTPGTKPGTGAQFKPISIKDYPVDGSSKGQKAGGRTKKTPADHFDRDIQNITDRTAALVAETEAQRQINPLINDYGYAMEKARTEQELLNAAQKAGVALTPELRAQIAQTADQWALASAEAAKLAEAQNRIKQSAEEMAAFQKELVSGIVDGFINGASAAEVFANALGKIADKLIEIGLNSIFDGGGIGNLLGGIIGGGKRFATGGYTGSGGRYQPAGVVHKGEYVFDQDAVRKAGGPAALDAMRRGLKGYTGGGAVGPRAPTMPILRAPVATQQATAGIADVRVFVDQDGNWQAAVERISQRNVKQGLAVYDKGGAVRAARDLRQVNQRGYAK